MAAKEINPEDQVYIKASELKVGDVVLLNENSPHEVTYVFRFKVPMKHSPDKIILKAVEFSTGKIFEKTCSLSAKFVVPEVTEAEYQLQALDEEKYMSLLSNDGKVRDDVRLGPNHDLHLRIQELFKDVEASKTSKGVFLKLKSALGKERIVSVRVDDI